MADVAFLQVWQKIEALEGAAFRTARGVEFTYTFHKTYVVVSPGNVSAPRTFFQKIWERLRAGSVETAPSLQGQTYMLAILGDPRVAG
jgi:hypothetical protein